MKKSEFADDVITYRFHYIFAGKNGLTTEKVFLIRLDAKTLGFIPTRPITEGPEWTWLSHNQCPNCTLSRSEHPLCPIAKNLIELVDFFKSSLSYEEADVMIESELRTFRKQTSLQEGVSALLSMYMVTSGCPIMDKLRPMLRAHLPFSTVKETTYRMLSMYLLAQYFKSKHGSEPDWDLSHAKRFFEAIQIVNRHFWGRFATAKIEDASINALVILDNLAQYAAFSVDLGILTETELIFKAYFTD